MSQHRERDPAIDAALIEHRLPHDVPSQLADAFRAGYKAAQKHLQSIEPIATLHDDGYYTFKLGKKTYESGFAGWRQDVYAKPILPEAVTADMITK